MKTYYNEYMAANHEANEFQTKIICAVEHLIKEQLDKGYSIGEIQNLISEKINLFSSEYRLLYGFKMRNAKKIVSIE